MPTTSNFGWTTPADTDLVKDGALAIRTLGNGIDTSFLDLKGGSTDQVLAKNSNSDLDFKWVAQDDSNAIQNAIVDAKGDLISATAADTPARLAVGANGTVLTADSTEATGLKWATPAAGGKVLQVVQATYSTSTSNSTSTYADTGLSATITPSTTGSRILCMIYHPIRRGGGNANNKLGIRLVRTSTTIHQSPDLLYTDTLAAHEADGAYSLAYVDSPSTTSATTYKTTFANIANASTVVVQVDSRTAVMILTEIGA